jgi:integrase
VVKPPFTPVRIFPVPRDYKMTWIEHRRAWTAKYRKKKCTVSCKQLREDGWMVTSDTKEGSYTAANGWWKQKKHEIDKEFEAAHSPPPLREPERTAMIFSDYEPKERAEWDFLAGSTDKVREEMVNFGLDLAYYAMCRGQPLPERVLKFLPPERLEEIREGCKKIRGETAGPATTTLGAASEGFLTGQLANHRAGQLSAKKFNEKKTLVGYFVEFLGAGLDFATLDGAKWESYLRHVLSKLKPVGPWGPDRAQNAVTAARELVRWSYESGYLAELPRNLQRRFKVKDRTGERSKKKAAATWTAEEFKWVLSHATGRMRLFLLLMANCGFTQIDISDLKDAEVDWGLGQITRRRSKTRHLDQRLEVTYTLWPSTLSLLREYRSGRPVVLLTEKGTPYVTSSVDSEGVKHEKDGIRGNFARFQENIGFRKPLKGLRKMLPTLLATHAEFGRYAQYFLGHASNNTADTHYVTPSQERFEAALSWLGHQLGQVS